MKTKTLFPKIWANFAVTLDGKISTRNHTPAMFTSKEDKKRLTLIRSGADAVMVGRATLVKDNMAMGLPNAALRAERLARGQSEYPLRVIVSDSGKISSDLKLFQNMVAPVVILTTDAMPQEIRDELRDLATLHISDEKHVNLKAAMLFLKEKHGVKSICCEGGPTLFRSMLEADLIDELYLTIAPRVFGGKDAPTLTGAKGPFFETERHFKLVQHELGSDEIFLRYSIERLAPKATQP